MWKLAIYAALGGVPNNLGAALVMYVESQSTCDYIGKKFTSMKMGDDKTPFPLLQYNRFICEFVSKDSIKVETP